MLTICFIENRALKCQVCTGKKGTMDGYCPKGEWDNGISEECPPGNDTACLHLRISNLIMPECVQNQTRLY